DAGERGPGRPGGIDREGARRERELGHGAASASERDVRPPLALRRDPVDGSQRAARRDEHTQVISLRRHELLDEGPVPVEPRLVRELLEPREQRALVFAAENVSPPAPEPRLDDDGRPDRREGTAGTDKDGGRMLDSGAAEQPRRQELVVGTEEGGSFVQDHYPARRKRAESPEAVLDSVEGWQDVESAEGGVAHSKRLECVLRRHRLPRRAVCARGGEGNVGRSGAAGDERKAHGRALFSCGHTKSNPVHWTDTGSPPLGSLGPEHWSRAKSSVDVRGVVSTSVAVTRGWRKARSRSRPRQSGRASGRRGREARPARAGRGRARHAPTGSV